MDGARKRASADGAVPDDAGSRRNPRPVIVVEEAPDGNTVELRDQEPARAQFRADVLRGLTSSPKYLPSQYLYDERGARLFEKICELEEYYLTRTELSILRRHLPEIARCVGPEAVVVEPGSGSGIKAQLLLSGLERPAGFVPVDISRAQLVEVAARIDERSPGVEVMPVCADFAVGFELPPAARNARRRIGFLPGSTIGNFEPDDAVYVLQRLAEVCGEDAGLVVGVDLEKDPAILEAAYDDGEGVSRAFAKNFLVRANAELGTDFDPAAFSYRAPWNEIRGRIEMALVSDRRQTVHVGEKAIHFAAGEAVTTEYSYKYDLEGFARLADRAGCAVREVWRDPRRLFSVQYLVRA